jgi:hypothetical protein
MAALPETLKPESAFSLAVRWYLAAEQRDEGLARGSRLNSAARNDLTRADGFVVKALVGVIVRIKRGTSQRQTGKRTRGACVCQDVASK